MGRINIPRIVYDYMYDTGQLSRNPSEEHILNEAEWCLYNAEENPASGAFEYPAQSKTALRRFCERQRAKGIVPSRDFED